MSIAQKSQRGTIHPTSEEAGILCPRTPSFLKGHQAERLKALAIKQYKY